MKRLITEADVKDILRKGGSVIIINKDCIVTPLAQDLIRSKKISMIEKETESSKHSTNQPISHSTTHSGAIVKNKVAIGSDHTGFRIKNLLIKYLGEKGYNVQDFGTYDEKSCDYPDFAKAVAESVVLEENDFGILIDATGIPSAITANKIKGIRAATCYDVFSARSSRAHNNANVLVVGAKSLGEETIKLIVDEWLAAEFEGGRHQKRLDKIKDIENE
jgi:ribose 5-phosphate isomerase B